MKIVALGPDAPDLRPVLANHLPEQEVAAAVKVVVAKLVRAVRRHNVDHVAR
jgi:hypothetical protein